MTIKLNEAATSLTPKSLSPKKSPHDIRRVLSSKESPSGKTKQANMLEIAPTLSLHSFTATTSNFKNSLIDRGANGGMAGSNVGIIACTFQRVNISGINNYQVTNLKVVSYNGVINTHCGLVIRIFHQYAYMPTKKTIHSSTQLEHFKNTVDG